MEEHPVEPPPAPRRERPPRRPRRRPGLVALAWLVGIAVAFLVGLVVGRAVEDAPRPGGEQTIVRTLVPATVGPVEEPPATGAAEAP